MSDNAVIVGDWDSVVISSTPNYLIVCLCDDCPSSLRQLANKFPGLNIALYRGVKDGEPVPFKVDVEGRLILAPDGAE